MGTAANGSGGVGMAGGDARPTGGCHIGSLADRVAVLLTGLEAECGLFGGGALRLEGTVVGDLLRLSWLASRGFAVSIFGINRGLGIHGSVAFPPDGPLSRPGSERLLCLCADVDARSCIRRMAKRACEDERVVAAGLRFPGMEGTRAPVLRRGCLAAAILLSAWEMCFNSDGGVGVMLEMYPAPGWRDGTSIARLSEAEMHERGVVVNCGIGPTGAARRPLSSCQGATFMGAVFNAAEAYVRGSAASKDEWENGPDAGLLRLIYAPRAEDGRVVAGEVGAA